MQVSASKMGLFRCCQWWARPDAIAPVQAASAAAQRGTDRHLVLQAIVSGEDMPPLTRASLWGCPLDEWPAIEANIRTWIPADGQTEQAVYYQPTLDLARAARLTGAREYDATDGEIPGTVDLISGRWPTVEVWDYKTGRQDALKPVEENAQLAFLALVCARLVDATTAIAVLAVVSDDGTANVDRHEYDSLDIDGIADEVRALAARIPTATPKPGGWCESKWCACRAVCPAMHGAIVATPAAPLTIEIHDAATCARVHTQLALAEEFLEQVKRARNAFLESAGSVPLADGTTLVWAEESRETIQCINSAKSYLVERGLEAAIDSTTSKAALEKAVKAAPNGATIKERMTEILADLHSMGAVKVTTYNKPKVKKSKVTK